MQGLKLEEIYYKYYRLPTKDGLAIIKEHCLKEKKGIYIFEDGAARIENGVIKVALIERGW